MQSSYHKKAIILRTLVFLGCLFPFFLTAQDSTSASLELLKTAARCDAESMSELVKLGADPNSRLNTDTREVVDDIDESYDRFPSVLELAIMCETEGPVKELISLGVKPNEENVFNAIIMNQYNIAKILIENKTVTIDFAAFATVAKRMSSKAAEIYRKVSLDSILLDVEPSEDYYSQNEIPQSLEKIFVLLTSSAFVDDPNDPVIKFLEYLKKVGFDINQNANDSSENMTPRSLIAMNGDILLAKQVKSLGGELPETWTEDDEKRALLAYSAKNGNLAAVNVLLNENIDPNDSFKEVWALAEAAANGHHQVVNSLIKAGADPMLYAAEGVSPLVSLAASGNVKLVNLILEAGAELNLLDGTDNFALRAATRSGASEMVKLLLKAGADPNFKNSKDSNALHGLIRGEKQGYWGWGDDRILNPLHYECIDFLVEAGIDLNTENTNGDTVLTSNFGKSKNAKLLGHLIASGAKVTDLAIARSMGGDSSLLRSLLVSYDKKISTNLITLARKDLRKDSSHLIALLERDFELYDEEYEIDSLLKDVSALDSELALGLLVNRGLVINIDRFHLALESALKNGSQVSDQYRPGSPHFI